MSNNPAWLSLLGKIADSWEHSDRSLQANQTDKAVHMGIVVTLMLGKPLTDNQAAAFLESIRRRVPFRRHFTFKGMIALNRKQREYAQRSGLAAKLMAKFDQPVKGAQEPDRKLLEQLFSTNSPRILQKVPSVSPDHSDLRSRINGLGSFTARDLTGLYPNAVPTNPDTAGVVATRLHQTGTSSPDGFVALNAASPAVIGEGDLKAEAPALDWQIKEAELREREEHRRQIQRDADEQVQRFDLMAAPVWDTLAKPKVALWYEPQKQLTGEITIDGERLYVDFKNYHRLPMSFRAAHDYSDHDRLWYSQFWVREELRVLTDYFKQHSARIMPDHYEFAVSPIYEYGTKGALAHFRTFATAHFDAAGMPCEVRIFHGEHRFVVALKSNKSRKAKAPQFVS